MSIACRALGILLLALATPCRALFVGYETERVPIGRVRENLARRLELTPGDVRLRYQLARVHAMAASLPWAEPRVYRTTKRNGKPNDVRVAGFIEFDPYSDDGTPRSLRDSLLPPEKWKEDSRVHLAEALRHYEEAIRQLRTEPAPQDGWGADILRVQMGYGWCLEQAGRRAEAIESYRIVLGAAWAAQVAGDRDWVRRWRERDFPKEPEIKGGSIENGSSVSFAEEAIRCIVRLLDPAKDAVEIAKLKALGQRLEGLDRMYSPILVPLRDLPFENLVQPGARVRFDLDGSGLPREWGWITPDAAWLVHDPSGEGSITSGLQLFGNVTFWIHWKDGYEALRSLDDDGDGELAGAELRGLALWHDADGDGVSSRGEVRSLEEHGIVALSCAGRRVRDDLVVSELGARYKDGRTRPSYDWFAPMNGVQGRK